MITVLTGDNSFELERALGRIVAAFSGQAERFDGSSLELRQLPDLVMGGTLFATERLIVISRLSENAQIWPVFSDWLNRVSADTQLVLVEPKLDKRTKTYKDLAKAADLQVFTSWSDRDQATALRWIAGEATILGMALDTKQVQAILQRTGLDQWRAWQALQKLVLLDEVTLEAIERLIDANPSESVFGLLEAALRGDSAKIQQMIAVLALQEDPFRLFGLLTGQIFQLAALAVSDKPSAEVAKDLGAHPFAVSKLASPARTITRAATRELVAAFAQADIALKTTAVDPWLVVERALLRVAAQRQ